MMQKLLSKDKVLRNTKLMEELEAEAELSDGEMVPVAQEFEDAEPPATRIELLALACKDVNTVNMDELYHQAQFIRRTLKAVRWSPVESPPNSPGSHSAEHGEDEDDEAEDVITKAAKTDYNEEDDDADRAGFDAAQEAVIDPLGDSEKPTTGDGEDPVDDADEDADLTNLHEDDFAALETIRQFQKHLDNPVFQPQDHAAACKLLGCSSQSLPRMALMAPNRHFMFWQPVAAAQMVRACRDRHLTHNRGYLLADQVGIGKTITVLGFLLYVSGSPFGPWGPLAKSGFQKIPTRRRGPSATILISHLLIFLIVDGRNHEKPAHRGREQERRAARLPPQLGDCPSESVAPMDR
jgi:hypothetical protein